MAYCGYPVISHRGGSLCHPKRGKRASFVWLYDGPLAVDLTVTGLHLNWGRAHDLIFNDHDLSAQSGL